MTRPNDTKKAAGGGRDAVEVVEYTDPGCSYAWGSEPKLRLLRWRHSDVMHVRRVMGGLVGDMSSWYGDSFDAERAAPTYVDYWRDVSETTGMPYPARLRRMYRSTEPACRAVEAAGQQGELAARRTFRRLQESTFVFGEPPDTPERVREALAGFDDVDADDVASRMTSPEVEEAFRRGWEEARDPNDHVLGLDGSDPGSGAAKRTEGHVRYVFPTLVLRGPGVERTVPGWRPYAEYEAALEAVAPGSTEDARPDPSPEEAFERWPTMAPRELELVCVDDEPPDGVVTHDWGDGEFYLRRDEAEARGLA